MAALQSRRSTRPVSKRECAQPVEVDLGPLPQLVDMTDTVNLSTAERVRMPRDVDCLRGFYLEHCDTRTMLYVDGVGRLDQVFGGARKSP